MKAKWKSKLPDVRMAKMYDGSYDPLKGKIQMYKHGNFCEWVKPKAFMVGFSGSMNDPHKSMSIYIGKVRITFWSNPFKGLMDWNSERKLDKQLKESGERCPYCGSHKLREGSGMAHEPVVYCKDCGAIVYESDPEPYIR